MGAKENFKDRAKIRRAQGDEELTSAIEMCEDNAYLLDDELTGPDRPLELLYTDESLVEHRRQTSEHYYISNEDDLIVAALTIDNQQEGIIFEQISTHADYRQRGYAQALIEAVMRRALEDGKTLYMQGPTEMGAKHIIPMIRKLHEAMPGLKVVYFGENCPATLQVPVKDLPHPVQIAA
jgi:predicted GNAT family acetyltransferase